MLVAKTYQVSDMSQTYPLMRGTAPLLVAAISVLFLGDRLSPLAWLGIGVICLAILAMAFNGRASSRKGDVYKRQLQSFSSGPTLPGGSPTKNPARFAPAGFGIRVVPDPTAHCRRRPPQTRRPPRLARFLVGSKRSGLRSLGTCCVEK